ncbi:MAG: L,D-transpeptidase [Candidatus Zixiibacteriota bacterium]
MRYRYWYVSAVSVLLAWFIGAWLIITGGRPYPGREVVPGDSLSVELPQDERLARRELARAKNALSRIKPSLPYIVIDTHANVLTLRTEDRILLKTTCSTGSGGELTDPNTGRRWVFDTPRGIFKVTSKLTDPWWRKPDWAFIEENESIPEDPRERLDPEMLGEYALGFGDDYYIHGTIYERLLGVNVTHGCVRVGSDDLERLYSLVPIGTLIYIF